MKSTTLISALLALFVACGVSFGAGYFVAKSEVTEAPESLAAACGEADDAESDETEPELLSLPEQDNEKPGKEEETGPNLKPDISPEHETEGELEPEVSGESESSPTVQTEPARQPASSRPADEKAAAEKEALDKAREKLKELEGKLEGIEPEDFESIFNGKKVDFEATVSGSVVDSNGIPVAGAKIYADYSETYNSDGGGRRVSFVMAGGEDKGSVIATTDGSGLWQASISRQVSEKASLRADFTGGADGYADSEKNTVTLKSGDNKSNIKLVLRGAGSVTGRVVDDLGRGVPGVNVGLNKAGGNAYGMNFDFGGGSKYSAQTDAAGEFRIEGVPEGRYKFKLTGTGIRQISGPTEIDVESGREARAPADFQVAATSSIRVQLKDSSGNPINGWATLKLKTGEGKVADTFSGMIKDGVFEQNDPPAGSFEVEVKVYGYQPQTVRATVIENQSCDLGTLILNESSGEEEGGITIFPDDE